MHDLPHREKRRRLDAGTQTTTEKRKARQMVQIGVSHQSSTSRTARVDCIPAIDSVNRPKVIPSLAELYSVPLDEDPDEILRQAPGRPPLIRSLTGISGPRRAERLASVTSFTAGAV